MAATTTPLSEHGRIFDPKTRKWRARTAEEADAEELHELTATPKDIKGEGRAQARSAEANDPLATDAATAERIAALDEEAAEAREERASRRRATVSRAGSRSRRVAGRSLRQTRSIGGSIYRMRGQAAQAYTGGGASFAGVMVATLGVILLYLLLTKANLAATVISGVTKALDWIIAPKVLPF